MGTPYCHECAEAVLVPIRQRVLARDGMLPAITSDAVRYTSHAPSHGVGMWWMECAVCGATWVGPVGDECSWCARRYLRALATERAELLALRATESVDDWVERMASGIKRGVISQRESVMAIQRCKIRRD